MKKLIFVELDEKGKELDLSGTALRKADALEAKKAKKKKPKKKGK